MKRIIKDWLLLLAVLLDNIAIILIILLILWLLKIPVSLPIVISLIVLFIVFVFLMKKFVIPTLHSKKITGSEGMIGLKGIVTKTLKPCGIVNIKGECWKARSIDGYVSVDKQVEIVAMDGLTLHVKRKK